MLRGGGVRRGPMPRSGSVVSAAYDPEHHGASVPISPRAWFGAAVAQTPQDPGPNRARPTGSVVRVKLLGASRGWA
jgi:hypothetical protein